MGIPRELDERLHHLAGVPVLLVATDYDGTLSPIVSDPARAQPHREAMVAVHRLADLPRTHVAVISGRALSDLAALTGAGDAVRLVGSHGSEFDPDFASSLPEEAVSLRERVREELERVALTGPGFSVEVKPASVAFHYRNADPAAATAALDRIGAGAAGWDGVRVKRGKMVMELAVIGTSKGTALSAVRHRVGASAVLFLGDDATDEDAFGTLSGPDVGVKVGEGETAAAFRVGTTDDVARLLARLCELREAWATGAHAVPIEHHAMLTDQRTVVLVAPGARIVWACLPRIDSPALFAELLGGPAAGYFEVRPAEAGAEPRVEYDEDTFHLRTVWPGLSVTDWLDCSGGRPGQRAGRSDLVRVVEGSGRVRIEYAPRVDFGRVRTRLEVREDGLVVDDSFDPVVLRAEGVRWRFEEAGEHQTAVGEVDLTEGRPLVLELRYGTGSLRPSVVRMEQRDEQTRRYWSSWAGQLALPPVAPEAVRRSALVLRGLCHGPSGGIAAAGTTSLPEWIGGVRNWDYRYCWPRDASMAAAVLARLGSVGEGLRLLDWLLHVVDQSPAKDRLAPVYTVTGGTLHAEAEIGELSGYAGSRPVRVGNAASRQVQLDVFGPIVELVHLLVMAGAPLSSEHWRLVEAMVEAVRAHWREPDHGIWEIRAPKRHHVHSRVMCWQTARLGAEIAEVFAGVRRPAWEECRDEIAADVLENGWNERAGAFTTAYGFEDVDAAVLHLGLTGLMEPGHERFVRTVEAVERHLRGGATVWRYRCEDGLPGPEGGFNLCTSWLIRAYHLAGRDADARELFEQYLGLQGPTGLIPEEHDPQTGRGLGNHPQAYSHIGLVEAALALGAPAGSGRGPP